MKIKKILSIILAGVMVMALLTGCGSSKNNQFTSSNNQSSASTETPNETTENAAESTTGSVEANTAENAVENATEADTTADNNTTGSTGKTLVVYYSATGTTKGVAEKIAEWPVNNFVKNNDFTGKKVITFCTAASSGIGDSGNLLKEMAGTGDWQDGERLSEDEVQSWVRDNF